MSHHTNKTPEVKPRSKVYSNYKIRPALNETFKPIPIKNIIRSVLTDTLQGKTYTPEEAAKWSKEIADNVNVIVKELEMPHFKHVVQVTLGQQMGSGCRYIAKCLWDPESDGQSSAYYTNASLFCVCTVFGIYLY